MCCVCACLHHGKQIKSVVEWKEKLETVLGVYQYIPGVTPIHFCSNCVRKVTKCINDSKVTTALKPVEWVEHLKVYKDTQEIIIPKRNHLHRIQ